MVCHYMFRPFRGGDFSSQIIGGHGRYEAAKHVRVLALAGNIDITAEIVDDDGEVIASYERGQWKEAK